MDKSELLALEYLNKKFSNVKYEPQGNVCPDFVVDNSIAVEVRRLNQNVLKNGKYRGIEDSIPLTHRVKNLLKTYDVRSDGKSWFVGLYFTRDFPKWEKLKPLLKTFFDNFDENTILRKDIEIAEGFKIFLDRASPQPKRFLLGGYVDADQGGFVVAEVLKNIYVCLQEKREALKEAKAKFVNNYKEWILILDDQISRGLNTDEIEDIRKAFQDTKEWDKIIIICKPHNKSEIQAFDLK